MLQEDRADMEEGPMLLCDGCNKGTHMRCSSQHPLHMPTFFATQFCSQVCCKYRSP